MESGTKLGIVLGAVLLVGAILAILFGDGLRYLANVGNAPTLASTASTLVSVGYTIIGVLVAAFVSVVAVVVYRAVR